MIRSISNCPCNLKNIVSIELRCSHKLSFQDCIWFLSHVKLKLCYNAKVLGALGVFRELPQTPQFLSHLHFATMWGLGMQPAQKQYTKKIFALALKNCFSIRLFACNFAENQGILQEFVKLSNCSTIPLASIISNLTTWH